MQLALAGRSLGVTTPLEEDIRLAAVTGYPWLLVERTKLDHFLDQPELDARDLKRLFLRTQPAALETLILPNTAAEQAPALEALCKQARRLGAPVLVVRVEQADEHLAALADIAARWSTALALTPAPTASSVPFADLRRLIEALGHPALGLYTDLVSLWQAGQALQPEDAARTIIVAIGDVDEQGRPTLPGDGVLPLAELLAPLHEGGYDGLAALALNGADAPLEPEAFAGAGRRALADLLQAVGWSVETAP